MKRIPLHNLEETAGTIVDFLMGGGTVVMPMDTSYGIAADATNNKAVEEVFSLKGRDPGKSLSVVVEGLVQAKSIGTFNADAEKLWTSFMPGSLTLIVPLASEVNLSPQVTANGHSVGLRQPKNDLTQLVAERLQRPYTATSANRSGNPPAFSVDEFLNTLPDELVPHLVVDGGELPIGLSSTVVSVADGVEVIREGVIPAEEITAITG